MPTTADKIGNLVSPGGHRALDEAWGSSEGKRRLYLARGGMNKAVPWIREECYGTLSTLLWTAAADASATAFASLTTTAASAGGVWQGVTSTSDDLGATVVGLSNVTAAMQPGIEVRFRQYAAAPTATTLLQAEIGFLNAVATAAAGTPAISLLSTVAFNTGVTEAALACMMGDDTLYGWTIATLGSGAGQVATAVTPSSGIVPIANLWQRIRLQTIANQPAIQSVYLTGGPTGGTYTLAYPGAAVNSGTIAWNASAATVQTAVRNITGLASSTVSGATGGPYYICLAGTTTPSTMLTVAANALTPIGGWPTPAVNISAIGQEFVMYIEDSQASPLNSQIVTINGSPTGGAMHLQWNGVDSGAVAGTNNPTAAQVQTAVRLITGLESALVTGATGGPYYVQMLGTLSGPPALLTSTNTFTGGTAPSISITPSQMRMVQNVVTAQINPNVVLHPYLGFFSNGTTARTIQIDSIEVWADRVPLL